MKKVALILAIIMIVSIVAVCIADAVDGHLHMYDSGTDKVTNTKSNQKASYVHGCNKLPGHMHWHGSTTQTHTVTKKCKCGHTTKSTYDVTTYFCNAK